MASSLLLFLNTNFKHGHTPESLNMADVIPIPKTDNLVALDNYQGIFLMLILLILLSKQLKSAAASGLKRNAPHT